MPHGPGDSPFRGERTDGKGEPCLTFGLALAFRPLGVGGIRTSIYILNMVEAKRGSPASVLQGFSREGLIVAVDKAEEKEEKVGQALVAKTHGLTGHCMGPSSP